MQLNTKKNGEVKGDREHAFFKLMRFLSIREEAKTVNEDVYDENRELIESIKSAKKEWENANLNFEFACDEGIVDYYTYKIKACQVRYEYLVRIAKEKGIKAGIADSSYEMSGGSTIKNY